MIAGVSDAGPMVHTILVLWVGSFILPPIAEDYKTKSTLFSGANQALISVNYLYKAILI
jgi:hypothetical protein